MREIEIEAELQPDGRTITGTLRSSAPLQYVDPLAALPEPNDPLTLLRTYPGGRSRGEVTWQPADDGLQFTTHLPRRWGDVGSTRKHGVFANGAWYPQPEGLPEVSWTVQLTVPDGMTAAVGGAWGTGTVRWQGVAERAPIAVLPRAVDTTIDEDGVRATLLTRGKPRQAMRRELRNQLVDIAPAGADWSGVIVEAPLRRRLARSGPGLAYVSDRAWRVSPGLHRFHHVAVARGVGAALMGEPDPYERDIIAAALSQRHSARLRGADARRTLRWASWLPTIDALLYSRTMAFVGDILEETHPADLLRDDLAEVHAPAFPGTVVVAQLDDAFGPATGWRVAAALQADAALDPDLHAFVEGRRARYPVQDYQLDIDGSVVRVTREGEPGPTEPVVVRVDGVDQLLMGSGTIKQTPAPGRVALDPKRHLSQTSRAHDTWPARFRVLASGNINTINLSEGWVDASGSLWTRKQYDTRQTWWGSLGTNRRNLVAGSLGYTRRFGPKLDGLTHQHAIRAFVSPAWLNPAFAETEAPVVLGGGLSYTFQQRYPGYFPLGGTALAVSTDGGFVPTTDQTWAAARVTAQQIVSPHLRHAVAMRVTTGIARGDVPQRLLSLGGPGNLSSIAPEAAPATTRAVGKFEYRWAALRGASVPVGFGWATALQLSAGAEAGVGHVDGELVRAAGVTAGIAATADMLGFEERMMGVTAGWPVYVEGLELERSKYVPELYLRWWQAF